MTIITSNVNILLRYFFYWQPGVAEGVQGVGRRKGGVGRVRVRGRSEGSVGRAQVRGSTEGTRGSSEGGAGGRGGGIIFIFPVFLL